MPDPAAPPPPAPSASRVRDALLGGNRNRQCDRDLARRLELRFPGTAQSAAEARAFAGRAVTFCARQGIAQYVIPEPGLPLPGGAAEAARAVIPGARVAYAVTDPSEMAYARREAARGDATAAVRDACAGDPAGLLADPALLKVIDLGEPAAVVLVMTASLMPADEAAAMVGGFARLLAPGSAIALSAWVPHPGPNPGADRFVAACAPAAAVYRHTVAGIGGWLSGLDVVEPGVTDVRGWRAGMAEPRLRPRPVGMTAGAVAVKRLDGQQVPGGGVPRPLVEAAALVGGGGDRPDPQVRRVLLAGVGELLGEPQHLIRRRGVPDDDGGPLAQPRQVSQRSFSGARPRSFVTVRCERMHCGSVAA